MKTKLLYIINGILLTAFFSILFNDPCNYYLWFISLIIMVYAIITINITLNNADQVSMKTFCSLLEQNQNDIKWLKGKKLELRVSRINNNLNRIKIEELDLAIEKLLKKDEPIKSLEIINSEELRDVDLVRVAYPLYKVHEKRGGGGTEGTEKPTI